MAKLDFYYGLQKVNEDIANWRDLEIEVSFDNDSGQGVVKTGAFEFVGDLADKINKWNAQGMTGGAGIFEAPPFRIEVCNGGNVFYGGINTADCSASYECDKVIAPLRAQTIDFLNDRASSFSFAYLYSLSSGAGKISQNDFIKVPYVINSIPDYVNVMTAGLSLFMMVKEVKEIIEKTAAVIAEINGDAVVAGTSGANPVTLNVGVGYAIGRVLVDIVRITFYLLYLAFIIIAIIDLTIMLFSNLIQPVKYKKAMRSKDLFGRACDYLSLSFSSTLLNSSAHQNDVIVPRKSSLSSNTTFTQNLFSTNFTRKDNDDNNNPSSVGYPDMTFADLILAEEQRLNAEVRVIGNTLYFERKDFFQTLSSYTLPNIKNRNADPHGTNACELASNYLLSYSLDDQDTNTYDQYTGTSCQMQLAPNVISNPRNVLLKNITEITLQYALAKRKNQLNGVEEVFNAVYAVVGDIYNAITGFFNVIISVINAVLSVIAFLTGGSSFTINPIAPFPPSPLGNRIGMMLLSSDFIGVPKILTINSSNKLPANNEVATAARTLMDELHYTNFAVRKTLSNGTTVTNDFNQWLTYTDKEVPFCCEDYKAILTNNFIKTYDQKIAKIKSLIWNPYKETAKITYHVREQYTNNFKQKYIIDGKPL